MKIYTGAGRTLPISLSGSRLENDAGETTGYLLSFHDTREFLRELNGHSRSIAAERDRSTRLEVAADEANARNQFITETVLKRYVSPSLINDILDGNISMDKPAELRTITVCFGIAGFTRAKNLDRLPSQYDGEFFTVIVTSFSNMAEPSISSSVIPSGYVWRAARDDPRATGHLRRGLCESHAGRHGWFEPYLGDGRRRGFKTACWYSPR